MKRTYYAVLAIALGFSTMLYSCGTENTTGVDTETTESEVEGEMDQENETEMMNENTASPLDTATNIE